MGLEKDLACEVLSQGSLHGRDRNIRVLDRLVDGWRDPIRQVSVEQDRRAPALHTKAATGVFDRRVGQGHDRTPTADGRQGICPRADVEITPDKVRAEFDANRERSDPHSTFGVASRPGRLATIRAIADRVLVIFPFEAAIYEQGGVPVEFVGHPLIDLAKPAATRERFLADRGLAPAAPTVAILPGSRPNEVSRILPDLAAAARLIRRDVPAAQFVVARAPRLAEALFEPVRGGEAGTRFTIVEGDTDTVLASADVALTASGTATIQAALHDTPMVVVYRMAPLSYQLARRVVNVDTIAMVNLIAGETIAPELVQDAFTPEAVAREAVSMLTDRDRAARIRAGLAEVRARLGGPGASRRAAEAILRVIAGRVA